VKNGQLDLPRPGQLHLHQIRPTDWLSDQLSAKALLDLQRVAADDLLTQAADFLCSTSVVEKSAWRRDLNLFSPAQSKSVAWVKRMSAATPDVLWRQRADWSQGQWSA
jgi:hypothetical protein